MEDHNVVPLHVRGSALKRNAYKRQAGEIVMHLQKCERNTPQNKQFW